MARVGTIVEPYENEASDGVDANGEEDDWINELASRVPLNWGTSTFSWTMDVIYRLWDTKTIWPQLSANAETDYMSTLEAEVEEWWQKWIHSGGSRRKRTITIVEYTEL